MSELDIKTAIESGVKKALNEPIMDSKSIAEWAVIGMKASHWINVKDKLPDKDGLYLCWTLINNIDYRYQIELWKDNHLYWIHDVHYWMPLPEPPKDVNAK